MDEGTNRRTNGRMDGWADGRTDGRTDGRMNEWKKKKKKKTFPTVKWTIFILNLSLPIGADMYIEIVNIIYRYCFVNTWIFDHT